jgi:hypothetical protein
LRTSGAAWAPQWQQFFKTTTSANDSRFCSRNESWAAAQPPISPGGGGSQ